MWHSQAETFSVSPGPVKVFQTQQGLNQHSLADKSRQPHLKLVLPYRCSRRPEVASCSHLLEGILVGKPSSSGRLFVPGFGFS